MEHRHLDTTEWTPMALESLFDRGRLADWRDFVRALRGDPGIAERALRVARGHEDARSAALVRLLVAHFHPALLDATPEGAAKYSSSLEGGRNRS